jgi:tetratricopeptide (TPR) repeat protein
MTHTILLLTANPQDTPQLKLDQEVAIINQYLPHEQFTVHSALTVTPEQLRATLLTHQPEVVHFSGHGAGEQGIVLQNPQGKAQLVSTDALANLFVNFPTLQCVILNACYSAVQASALVKHIPFVIGMNRPIGDRAAILFSTGFYQALGAGQSVETAFNLGRNNIELQGLDEQSKPVLKQRRVFAQRFEQLPFPPNPYFTGREKVLREMLEMIHFHRAVAVSGVGKTQTAMQFVYQHQHEYQAILWCQADSADNLTLSMAGLASVLELPPQQEQAENLKSVMQWLATHEHWLLILDNADDVTMLQAWLPQLRQGAVVVTTRAKATEPIVKSVPLAVMSATEAIDLLAGRTNQSLEGYDRQILLAREQAGKLAELLGYLPLALDQAAAYIVETGSRFEDYIKLYQTDGMKLLERRGMLASGADHPDPVAVTWSLSFEKVEKQSELAVAVLQVCAFLYADGILEETFQAVDEFEFNEALAEILKYSLLQRDRKRNLLAMHRLVQEVLRAQLPNEQQQAVAEVVIHLLARAYPDWHNPDYLAWSKRSAEWLLNAQQGEQWIQRWQLQSEDVGLLLNDMGYYLNAIAEYDQILPLYEQALQIRKQVLGLQHPDYAQSLNNLAELYRTQGEYDKALPLYEQAVAIVVKVLGEKHPTTQKVKRNYERCRAAALKSSEP